MSDDLHDLIHARKEHNGDWVRRIIDAHRGEAALIPALTDALRQEVETMRLAHHGNHSQQNDVIVALIEGGARSAEVHIDDREKGFVSLIQNGHHMHGGPHTHRRR